LVGKRQEVCSRSREQARGGGTTPLAIVTESDVRLEKAGEFIIKGVVAKRQNQQSSKEDEGIFSPDLPNLMKRNVIAATALVKCNDFGNIPVRILVSDPITLYKGTRLGELDTHTNDLKVRSLGVGDSMFDTKKDILNIFKSQLEELPVQHAEIMENILEEYKEVFSSSKMDIGCAVGVEHCINTGNSPTNCS
jgi:hypothetical protein